MIKNILTIAASDSGGGAGIQADIKVCSALGAYSCSAITAVTAQNTKEITKIEYLSYDMVFKQITAILDDIKIDAIKIGMLGNIDIINGVSDALRIYKSNNVFLGNIVIDPVMVASSGANLLKDDSKDNSKGNSKDGVIDALISGILPRSDFITPNIPEALRLLKLNSKTIVRIDDMKDMASDLYKLTKNNIYLKGGHLADNICVDYIYTKNKVKTIATPRIISNNTHGTGCCLSTALAVFLAQGCHPIEAGLKAHQYLLSILKSSDKLNIGSGSGSLHHFYNIW